MISIEDLLEDNPIRGYERYIDDEIIRVNRYGLARHVIIKKPGYLAMVQFDKIIRKYKETGFKAAYLKIDLDNKEDVEKRHIAVIAWGDGLSTFKHANKDLLYEE